MSKKPNDPFFEREKEKYEEPVPSREFILGVLKEQDNKGVTYKQLLAIFQLHDRDEEEGLRRRLRAMVLDGQLAQTRRGKYVPAVKSLVVEGTVESHRDGFGFLLSENGGDDVFLPARQMRGVFNGDRIQVRIISADRQGRKEGRIVDILERNTRNVVGRLCFDKGVYFVSPDSKAMTHDVIISSDQHQGAKVGQFVEVEITRQPDFHRPPEGKVIDILGDELTPGMEVELAIRSHNLPYEWPKEVVQESRRFHPTLEEHDYAGRKDLRALPLVTIDGEDAKDFDDAVYAEPSPHEGWRLIVAIADVSFYVKPGSALDKEAQLRGNSVYFPARVIPMLPEALSNGLCSLKPNEDRMAMVCDMQVDKEGKLKSFEFYPAIMLSHARLTYTEVADMIKGKRTKHYALKPQIDHLYELFKQLLKQRKNRGAIDFETTETRIIFDDYGKIEKIIPLERNEAHRLIEEMMLLANMSAARLVGEKKTPVLYRNHEKPFPEKLSALRDFLKAFSLRLNGGEHPKAIDYASLLERVMKREDAHLLQTVLLRSLSQAVYAPNNVGHFGLSYEGYCHFTSPIRRYPDLLLHRALKHLIDKSEPYPYQLDQVARLGEHCSFTERRADRSTRDAVDWLKCDYMQDKIGKTFDGIITDVTSFGLFIELREVYVQGLLHVTALYQDYYQHDPIHHTLIGKRSGKVYRLGDSIRILLARVNLDERQIDFDLA